MPRLEDVKLGVSPITDTMYMGTVSKKDPGLWLQKRDAMSDFCGALLSWVESGTIRTIRSSAGPWYEIEVREVAPHPTNADASLQNGAKGEERITPDPSTGAQP